RARSHNRRPAVGSPAGSRPVGGSGATGRHHVSRVPGLVAVVDPPGGAVGLELEPRGDSQGDDLAVLTRGSAEADSRRSPAAKGQSDSEWPAGALEGTVAASPAFALVP